MEIHGVTTGSSVPDSLGEDGVSQDGVSNFLGLPIYLNL